MADVRCLEIRDSPAPAAGSTLRSDRRKIESISHQTDQFELAFLRLILSFLRGRTAPFAHLLHRCGEIGGCHARLPSVYPWLTFGSPEIARPRAPSGNERETPVTTVSRRALHCRSGQRLKARRKPTYNEPTNRTAGFHEPVA